MPASSIVSLEQTIDISAPKSTVKLQGTIETWFENLELFPTESFNAVRLSKPKAIRLSNSTWVNVCDQFEVFPKLISVI